MDRSKFVDSSGKPLTQSLFLELQYQDAAVYSLQDADREYEGRFFPSIKRLYLEMQDPTEYEFATTYFLGWRHWQRLNENKLIRKHIDEWREELEYKLRSQAVKGMLDAAQGGNYQAIKWLADRGWNTRVAGRPSKVEVEAEKATQARLGDEYGADIHRLFVKQG